VNLLRAVAIACALVPASARAQQACADGVNLRLIPLPVYSTLPNEGSTFGVMPVFLRVCDPEGTTRTILAPSLTWNDVIHWTATARIYHYPSPTQTFNLIVSASTRINSNVLLQWVDAPRTPGSFTFDTEARWARSVFYRFFGIGPDTAAEAETSYTRIRAHLSGRVGLNFGDGWNAGVTVLAHHDGVQDIGVPDLPLSRPSFPDVPGMAGSTILGQALGIRYDSRPAGEYSDRGFFATAVGGPVEGLDGSPSFLRGMVQVRAIVPELSWLTGAGRFDWTLVSTPDAPFYDQSTLGGAFLLRGFTEDRFIDQNAWTVELDQRIRLLETHIYGVTADWRIDPFIAVGQVYRGLPQAFSHPRLSGGVGFRAFVHPNVLGRIDVASGGEGIKVYVEIGYPY
jgi:hypothetical protein